MTDADLADIKTRSRHRLIGAFVLVLLFVIAVPMILDRQAPRSESVHASVPAEVVSLELKKSASALGSEPPISAPNALVADPSSSGSGSTAPATLDNALPSSSPDSKSESVSTEHGTTAVIPPLPDSIRPGASDTAKLEARAKMVERLPAAGAAVSSGAPVQSSAPVKSLAPPATTEPVQPGTPVVSPPLEEKAETAKGWFVQLGVFAEEARAIALRERLHEHGVSLQTDTIHGPRGTFTRLRAGPYQQREDASSLLARIKALGENAILVHQ
jgi:DedD protein